MKTVLLSTLADTKRLASALVPHIAPVDAILLCGDLGAGKTSLAREIIHELLHTDIDVTSPTFNLVHRYDSDQRVVWHYDLYRLTRDEELLALDIEEALETGVVLIEWPELARSWLSKDYLQLDLSINEKGDRVASITGYGRWSASIEEITI